LTDIYLGEFVRLYRHFAFPDWLTHHPGADVVRVGHLDETDQWWKGYFGDSFESRQRGNSPVKKRTDGGASSASLYMHAQSQERSPRVAELRPPLSASSPKRTFLFLG
jgi:hypothetical protein